VVFDRETADISNEMAAPKEHLSVVEESDLDQPAPEDRVPK